MEKLISNEELCQFLNSHSDWQRINKIRRKVKLLNFAQSLSFVGQVAQLAESLNHHPTILVEYDTVILEVSTHTAGGVTAKDLELAKKIDELICKNAI